MVALRSILAVVAVDGGSRREGKAIADREDASDPSSRESLGIVGILGEKKVRWRFVSKNCLSLKWEKLCVVGFKAKRKLGNQKEAELSDNLLPPQWQ